MITFDPAELDKVEEAADDSADTGDADKAAEEDCAVIYDECNYKGNYVEVCREKPVENLRENEIKEVKSVRVPKGMTLRVW